MIRQLTITISGILLAIVTLNAQNFKPIAINDTNYYNNENDEIYVLYVDTAYQEGEDSVYKFLNNINNFEESCYYPDTSSWAGQKVLLKNNDSVQVYFNHNNDSVFIKPFTALNQEWTCFEIPDSMVLKARVTDEYSELIYSNANTMVTDSLKKISFQAYDNNGDSINIPVNNKNLILSQHHGFQTALNFHAFPDFNPYNSSITPAIQEYEWVGNQQYGVSNLTTSDIYDYDIGDEFHRLKTYWETSTPPSEADKDSTYSILEVINKEETQDTLFYTFSRKRRIHDDGNINKHADTISRKYIKQNTFNNLPGEPIIKDEDAYFYFMQKSLNERLTKTLKRYGNYIIKNNSCWHDYQIIDKEFSTLHYYKGLGGPYYTKSYPSQGGDNLSLVYYNKNNGEEWGDPINIVMSNKKPVTKNTNTTFFTLYPNPAGNEVYITIENSHEAFSFKLYNTMGNTIIERSGLIKKQKIEIQNIKSGIYMYKIISGNKVQDGKLMIR